MTTGERSVARAMHIDGYVRPPVPTIARPSAQNGPYGSEVEPAVELRLSEAALRYRGPLGYPDRGVSVHRRSTHGLHLPRVNGLSRGPGHSSRPWIAGGRASVPGLVVGLSSWRARCGRRGRTFGGGLRGVCTAGGARQKDADRAGIGGGMNVGTLLRTRSNLPAASATWLRRRLPWAVGLPPTRGSRPRAGAPSDPCSPAAAPRHRRIRRTARDNRRPPRSRPGSP
jgi:hypothetical protein